MKELIGKHFRKISFSAPEKRKNILCFSARFQRGIGANVERVESERYENRVK